MNLLFDPLFRLPFATGLVFAILLPLLGMYLRLRGEWLAALAFAQLASAGTLLAAVVGLPPQVGGLAAAFLGAGLKSAAPGAQGGAAYALMLLAGWGIGVLVVSNAPVAEQMGHALFDGQLYFTNGEQLTAALAYAVLSVAALRYLSRPLLLARFFPNFLRAQGQAEARYHLAFDCLIAAALALATASIGVMAAFALIFIPPMLAWRHACGWQRALAWAMGLGALCHIAAFSIALLLDQPYGPIAALLLVAGGLIGQIRGRRQGRP